MIIKRRLEKAERKTEKGERRKLEGGRADELIIGLEIV